MLALQDLWSNVVRCTADGSLLLSIMLQLGSKAEVSNLQSAFAIKEEVSQLQVAVNDTAPMQVLQSGDELIQVEHGFLLRQPLVRSLAHELVEGLVVTDLENDVDVLTILEVVIEVHYLLMVK